VDGVALDCFIFQTNRAPCTLFSKGRAYRLEVNEAGGLQAALRVVGRSAKDDEGGQEKVLDSQDYILPLNKWVKVGFRFNGYTFTLSAGGIQRNAAVLKEGKPPLRDRLVPHANAALMIGSGENPFFGRMDELRLSAVVLGDEIPFHEEIRLTAKKTQNIHFDASGLLDSKYHNHPESIEFIYSESRQYRVTIGLMGEVR
jgi:hypothetical protein